MNKFKQFLAEETAKVKEWVFHKNTHIPISRKMIERIEGAKEPIYAIHITNLTGLGKLHDISGTARQVSVMTDAGEAMDSLIMHGVATEGGVFTILKGIPLLQSAQDFWTKLDSQGRKWLSLSKLAYQAKSRSSNPNQNATRIFMLESSFWELKRDILLSAVKRYPEDPWVANFYADYQENESQYQQRDVDGFMEDGISLYWRNLAHDGMPMSSAYIDANPELKALIDNWKRPGSPLVQVHRKVKGFMISEYYKGTEKIMGHGKGLLRIHHILNDVDEYEYRAWDEISLTEFSIELAGTQFPDTGATLEPLCDVLGIPVDGVYDSTSDPQHMLSNQIGAYTKDRLKKYYKAVQNNDESEIDSLIKSAIKPSDIDWSEEPLVKPAAELIDFVEMTMSNADPLYFNGGFCHPPAGMEDVYVPYWKEDVNYYDWVEQGTFTLNNVRGLFYFKAKAGDLVNPFVWGELELAGAGKVVPISQSIDTDKTQMAFKKWQMMCNRAGYNIMEMSFDEAGQAAAYALGIAAGVFGDSNTDDVVEKAVKNFTEHEVDPDVGFPS
jgi:hypothetical protein